MYKSRFIFLFFLLIQKGIFGQNEIRFGTGLNRIGLAFQVDFTKQWKKHKPYIGVRWYEPDIVFQKDYPALVLGYNYNWKEFKKWRFHIGTEIDLSYDYKETVKLWLFNPKIQFVGQRFWSENWGFGYRIAIGKTINIIKTAQVLDNNTFIYTNYEITTGVTYRFGSVTTD